MTSTQARPSDSETPGKAAEHGEGEVCSVRDKQRFLAPSKTKFQREQKLWALQRPPAGPINTYKCLSKQSFNGGSFTKMVLRHTSKLAVPSKGTGLGAGGERKLCFLRP